MAFRSNVLVTGANGFTGRNLVSHLRAKNYNVIALDTDLLDRVEIAKSIDACRPDCVVHLAAISNTVHNSPEELYHVNVVGTVNLLDAITNSAFQSKRVILASSAAVYGSQGEVCLSEDLCPSPNTHYGCSKLAMEHMALTYQSKCQIIITRPFNYTGRDQNPHFLIPKIVSAYRARADFLELGNIDVAREFNDVRDVCAIYESLIECELETNYEVFNLCSGRAIFVKSILEIVSDISCHVLDVRSKEALLRSNDTRILKGNCSKLEAAVGYRWRHGIKDTLRWMYEGI